MLGAPTGATNPSRPVSHARNIATRPGAASANDRRASVAFDVHLSHAFHIAVPSVEVFQDRLQNDPLRLTPSAGFGCEVIRTKPITREVGTSVGQQATRYTSVSSGSHDCNDAALQLDIDVDIDLSKRFDRTVGDQTQLVMPDVGRSNQNVSTTLSLDF
jgi:hypothetical protein